MDEVIADLRRLMSLQTGDEKHDASATSTLDVLAVLYERVLRFDPRRPDWPERDRFLLSKGHGPMAFYAALAHAGYFPEDELARFLRRDGILGAHPDRDLVPGVDVSTGSLGHGLAMAIGVAHALRAHGLGEPRVYVLCGDAELNEGSNWEAFLYAGSRPLGNLTLIVVDNRSGAVPMGSIADKIAAFGGSRGGGLAMREPMRRAACEAAVELFLGDDSVAIVLAEISVDLFEPAFAHAPERAVNVGIMEQTMVGVAAGFALEGFRPVVHTIAPFLTERAHEQVKLDFGYQRLEGLFVTTGASYDYSTSGMTHHCPGDVAAMSTVPGMRVHVPGAPAEAAALVRDWHASGGLAYMRTSGVENAEARDLAGGGLTLLRRGRDATVIAVGPLLDRVLAAVEEFDVTVLYATTVYPLDRRMLREHAAPSPDVVLVEPMYEGTTTAQVAGAFEDRAVRLLSVGVPRKVVEGYGTVAELDVAVGLGEEDLARRIAGFLRTTGGDPRVTLPGGGCRAVEGRGAGGSNHPSPPLLP